VILVIERIRFIKNPLTIIAIFAGLAEIAGTTALALVDKELQAIFIWFVMGFPLVLVCLFFLTLNFNPSVLYAPSDFQDEQNFLRILANRRKLAEDVDIIDKQIEIAQANITERMRDEVQVERDVNQQQLVDYLKHAMGSIRDQLIALQSSADAVVLDAGRQAFPHSDFQARILGLLSESKHAMNSGQIASTLGMSTAATRRALDRLCNRHIISCEGNANEELYTLLL